MLKTPAATVQGDSMIKTNIPKAFLMKKNWLLCAVVLGAALSCREAPPPVGPTPTPAQLAWQQMEMNLFVHFGPNTFSGLEWGLGSEAEDLFCPTGLDCRQWARIARAAGMKGIILTAKHHDGFCLWPNPYSRHTVRESRWRDGSGDVLKELAEACAETGLKMGVYISPWDRNDPTYGTPAYNDNYARTLRSVHDGTYGPLFEHWFDGACGEGPNGKRQVYDWPLFHRSVLDLQPQAILFSDTGPGARWVGNERGIASETNWSTLHTEGFSPGAGAPPRESLSGGDEDGGHWIPAEADVSIRPGWFWREAENDRVKRVDELMDIYLGSVGRNAVLLLNVPPDTSGRIHPVDSARLMAFRRRLDAVFGNDLSQGARVRTSSSYGLRFRGRNLLRGGYDTFWAAAAKDTCASFILDLPQERCFNRLQLQEYIPLGQRIRSFVVEIPAEDGRWQLLAEGSTVGYKRILTFPEVRSRRIRVRITSAKASPVLCGAALFLDNDA